MPIADVDHYPSAQQDELSWQERALCAQTDPDAFFPEKGHSSRAAKRICVDCIVRAECLDYAMNNDERFGIWGGLSERERRRLRRSTRDAALIPVLATVAAAAVDLDTDDSPLTLAELDCDAREEASMPLATVA